MFNISLALMPNTYTNRLLIRAVALKKLKSKSTNLPWENKKTEESATG
jgi:cell division protein FtsL